MYKVVINFAIYYILHNSLNFINQLQWTWFVKVGFT